MKRAVFWRFQHLENSGTQCSFHPLVIGSVYLQQLRSHNNSLEMITQKQTLQSLVSLLRAYFHLSS
jgi:hypothetical protein